MNNEFITSDPKEPHRLIKLLKLPFGRLLWTPDTGEAERLLTFKTHLGANHIRRGEIYDQYDLGSGVVTNVGVMSMINDWYMGATASPTLGLSTLGSQNFHATGTGTTAAAETDIALQTLASPTTATAVTGAQSSVFAVEGTAKIYKNIATINYTSTLAITEWGLHSLATLSSSTGTPFTTTTATTWQDTGSAQTASATGTRGLQMTIVVPGTTTVWGLNKSNTTHVGTLADNGSTGWWVVSSGAAGSTPGTSEAFVVKPVMWDHKVFSAINVVSLDSIQFTYSLTISPGT